MIRLFTYGMVFLFVFWTRDRSISRLKSFQITRVNKRKKENETVLVGEKEKLKIRERARSDVGESERENSSYYP